MTLTTTKFLTRYVVRGTLADGSAYEHPFHAQTLADQEAYRLRRDGADVHVVKQWFDGRIDDRMVWNDWKRPANGSENGLALSTW
jgi:hypothetical protein